MDAGNRPTVLLSATDATTVEAEKAYCVGRTESVCKVGKIKMGRRVDV